MEAIFWNLVLGFPARGLKVIGVTGTDGKTTTSTMIYTMLNDAGIKTGLMTTIGYGVPGDWHDNHVHMTTMQTKPMLERIRQLRRAGIECLVLETTSHALAQHRVWGIPYSVAVVTNITHEHLDYHGTYERYREAKLLLFRQVAVGSGLKIGIINADDSSAPYCMATGVKPMTYGVVAASADLRAREVRSGATGSTYKLKFGDQLATVQVHLPGSFNVSNSLAAAAVGQALGLSAPQIVRGIGALKTVEGRMNQIDVGQDFAVIVDFAHTPDSFDKILASMRDLTQGRLIVMFGSAGRRDVSKRGKQGAIAGKWADVVVITEEDDRDVDGQEIMDQIAGGAESAGKVRNTNLFLVPDRTDAINFAVNKARFGQGDTVLLLGKGHEKTIERADGEHPWDELDTARQAVKQRLMAK
ncbi:UDP-N-acetylmuramoyl-L-alanyl-D-glutamate--2,6-diaminopimelate ligase [bacterium]|nr:MAG: UDP-N-acetylmuramoyl-L-alanyl-D-glutamate--2,6-diaminopimelate ligase [bacterium]